MGFMYRSVALIVGASLFLAAMVAGSYAQEISASHLQAARKAITASKSTDRLDAILPRMAEQAKAELIQNRPDQELQITTIVDEAAISLAGRRGDLETEVANVFARVFSEEELNAIADFFSSPAGVKFLSESPIVVREVQNASKVWTNGIRRDLGQAVQKKMQEAGLN